MAKRLNVDEINKAINLYVNEGKSINQVAKIMKRSSVPIVKILRDNNIEIRKIGFYNLVKCLGEYAKKGRTKESHPLFNKHHSKKTKDKISRTKLSEEWKERVGNKAIEKMKNSKYHNNLSGENNPFFGKHHNENTKKIIGNKNRGRIFSDVARLNMSKSRKGKQKSEEHLKAIYKALNLQPNKPEKIIINLIKSNNLNFEYVGDGKFLIEQFCPDFIDKKLIIEVFGDYWHNLPEYKERDERKLKVYYREGYKVLVTWQHELENTSQVFNKIEEFIKC